MSLAIFKMTLSEGATSEELFGRSIVEGNYSFPFWGSATSFGNSDVTFEAVEADTAAIAPAPLMSLFFECAPIVPSPAPEFEQNADLLGELIVDCKAEIGRLPPRSELAHLDVSECFVHAAADLLVRAYCIEPDRALSVLRSSQHQPSGWSDFELLRALERYAQGSGFSQPNIDRERVKSEYTARIAREKREDAARARQAKQAEAAQKAAVTKTLAEWPADTIALVISQDPSMCRGIDWLGAYLAQPHLTVGEKRIWLFSTAGLVFQETELAPMVRVVPRIEGLMLTPKNQEVLKSDRYTLPPLSMCLRPYAEIGSDLSETQALDLKNPLGREAAAIAREKIKKLRNAPSSFREAANTAKYDLCRALFPNLSPVVLVDILAECDTSASPDEHCAEVVRAWKGGTRNAYWREGELNPAHAEQKVA